MDMTCSRIVATGLNPDHPFVNYTPFGFTQSKQLEHNEKRLATSAASRVESFRFIPDFTFVVADKWREKVATPSASLAVRQAQELRL